MKKFLLYLFMFLGGTIAFVGWIIANVLLFEPGGVSSIMSALRSASGGVFFAAVFALIAIIGFVLAIWEVIWGE